MMCLQFLVDIGISAQAMQVVDQQVAKFIEEHEVDFNQIHSVQLSASADPLKLALVVGWRYTHNGVDGGRMAQSKSDVLQVCRSLGSSHRGRGGWSPN